MTRGGKRPGAGRKAGAATKRTREIADKLAGSGVTPLDVMLARMKGQALDGIGSITDEQFQAAVAAAPYIHPRLSSVDSTVKSDNVTHIISDQPATADEWEQQYGSDLAPAAGATESAG